MFSQLLEQCKQVFKSADDTIKSNKKALQQSRLVFPSSQNADNVDSMKNFNNTVSFSKAQRFRPIQKQQLKLDDVSFCQTEASEQNLDKKTKVFTFTKGQRFLEEKIKSKKTTNSTVLYPNYEVIKKNNKQGPVMRRPIEKDLSKSNISQATAASLTQVGPGKYFVQKIQMGPKKSTAFSKEKRFIRQKPQYEDNPLFISQNQTKKRPPSAAVLKKKIAKNAKLISKEQQQQMRERFKMIYWQSIPLELDRLFKSNIGPILRENYFNIKKMTGRQKRCAMLMMLDKLNFIRGGFEYDVRQKLQDNPCPVVYRKSTPKPFKFSQMEPGPDFYYPQDDLTKPGLIGFSFGKVGQQPQTIIYDNRDYEINEELMKKGGNIVINPLPEQHKLSLDQIKALNRGPGFYDCLFSQIEKRDDIGVVKFVQITEKNARQNNCVDIKKDVNDAAYFPSYNAIDPNVPVPLFKQDANVKPKHLPDKILFPEHWLFYDGDLNKVRAEIAKNVILAKNMDFKTYKIYTKRFQAFKEYLKAREPIPQVGQYNAIFTQLDPHVQGFQMQKKQEKTLIQPIKKEEGYVEGDNLLLNPQQLKDHLPNLKFINMVGRSQFEEQTSCDDEPKQGDRLILQPKKAEKKLPDIKFQNMKGRQNMQIPSEQEPIEGNVLVLNPKPIERHVAEIDFSKQLILHQPQILQLNFGQEVLVIDPKLIQKKIKGFVEMERMSNVRLVPVLRQKSQKKKFSKKEGSLSKKKKSETESQQFKSNSNE